MALFIEAKQESYRMHRAVSQGAGITLVYGCGEYTATFACASRCAEVLGNRGLEKVGGSIPVYKIAHDNMHAALEKLSLRYSVALVDLVCDSIGNRFVLIWKVNPAGLPAAPAEDPAQATLCLDDY